MVLGDPVVDVDEQAVSMERTAMVNIRLIFFM